MQQLHVLPQPVLHSEFLITELTWIFVLDLFVPPQYVQLPEVLSTEFT